MEEGKKSGRRYIGPGEGGSTVHFVKKSIEGS
jgi:hypothetical protein